MYDINHIYRVGNLICELREEKGLTQSELGEKIGVTNKAISRWENGRGYPDVSILLSLANELDVSVDELLRGELNDSRSDFEKKNSELRYKSSMTVLLRFSLTLIPLILAWTWILLSSRYTWEIYGPDGLNLNYLGRMFVGFILPLLLAHFANLFIGLFFAFRLQARKGIKISFIILLIVACFFGFFPVYVGVFLYLMIKVCKDKMETE